MRKLFLAACLTLLVCVACAPAASASPWLKEAGGVILPGTTVTAQNEGTLVRTNAVGSAVCHKSDMHGTVVQNNGSSIEIEFSSVTFNGATGGACETVGGWETWQAGGLPWCLRIGTAPVDSFTLSGGKCGVTPKAITLTLNGCAYVPVNGSLTGTYQTNTAGVGLTTTGQQYFKAEFGFCQPISLDPVKYNLTTAASPFGALTVA